MEHARALNVSVDPCHMDAFFLAATNGLGTNLEHENIALDCEQMDHSIPTLRNPRHERFAQELATGKSADAAYVLSDIEQTAVMLLG